jgi:hypothetical protein
VRQFACGEETALVDVKDAWSLTSFESLGLQRLPDVPPSVARLLEEGR